jgi:hypothetical protein
LEHHCGVIIAEPAPRLFLRSRAAAANRSLSPRTQRRRPFERHRILTAVHGSSSGSRYSCLMTASGPRPRLKRTVSPVLAKREPTSETPHATIWTICRCLSLTTRWMPNWVDIDQKCGRGPAKLRPQAWTKRRWFHPHSSEKYLARVAV